ncbi:hypothetical protein [Chryseobacterium sp. SIMBA_029]|uniref:hypothetical protein n=1 Tax=Chryseobacterium sp. SIMBA_029 TaxID=3085772 RepID=UPI003978F73B
MERELPTINIEKTEFEVDVNRFELREKNNPSNAISLFDMRDLGRHDGYVFEYSLNEKNIPSMFMRSETVMVKIPELVILDPIGMSEKYGVPIEMLNTTNDFHLMVNQGALEKRLAGHLPIVEIAGHPFYVDLRMDMLRPKDDFLSQGIVFSKIEDFYIEEKSEYAIPYNPKTHEFQQIDLSSITEIPKDIIVVSFPHENVLDPIGYNRKYGLGEMANLKERNLQSHFKAGAVSWKETGIPEVIRENKANSLKNEIPRDKNKKKGSKL